MNEVNELLKRSRDFLREIQKPKALQRPDGYSARHYHLPVGFYVSKEFRYPHPKSESVWVNIHYPENLDRVDELAQKVAHVVPLNVFIVLHRHQIGLKCDVQRFCHLFPYTPLEAEKSQFESIWGSFYRNIKLKVDLRL